MDQEKWNGFVRAVFRRLECLRENWRNREKGNVKKNALAVSFFLLILWFALGTTTTLAWFTDSTPAVRNSFEIGELELDVQFRNDVVREWTPLEDSTKVFNDQALYEPGYTQVVYIRIKNTGTMDFDYKLSVDRIDFSDSLNVYGSTLHLPKYLRFGVEFGDSMEELERSLSRAYATDWVSDYRDEATGEYHLNQYSRVDEVTVKTGETRFAYLVVYMPEDIGNEANYRGDPPTVKMGITVHAQQAGTPMEKE